MTAEDMTKEDVVRGILVLLDRCNINRYPFSLTRTTDPGYVLREAAASLQPRLSEHFRKHREEKYDAI